MPPKPTRRMMTPEIIPAPERIQISRDAKIKIKRD
jgi:hypothetical protein